MLLLNPFFIASASPVVIFLYIIYVKDKKKEPWPLLRKCFLGGFLVAALAMVIELILDIPGGMLEGGLIRSAYMAFIVASATEEILKWLILKRFIWKHAEFDQHYDGIIYAVFVSLGFAFIENLLYVIDGGMKVAVMRAVLSVPGHGLYAVIMGYHLSLAKFGKENDRTRQLIFSILIPIIFHGLYDFALMYLDEINENSPFLILALVVLFTLVVIFSWIIGVRNIKKHLNRDKQLHSPETLS